MQGLVRDPHVLVPPQTCQELADGHAFKPAEGVIRGFAAGAASLEAGKPGAGRCFPALNCLDGLSSGLVTQINEQIPEGSLVWAFDGA